MNTIRNSIQACAEEFATYRRTLHQNPQTAFEETFASDFVAEKLSEWGITFVRGFGKTGIVATIEGNKGTGKSIGLRADMDALDIIEIDNKDWTSKTHGKMHGCGHDGHTTILLAAAKHLSENPNFAGKVHCIFQPAEETGAGADAMIADGLFQKYPCDAIYGLHNWPSLPLGTFDIHSGPTMASVDSFKIIIKGRGGHAAQPHRCLDPIPVAAQVVCALQTIISREIHPLHPAVISVTNINGGTGASNVIPDTVTMIGSVRTYDMETKKHIEDRISAITHGLCAAAGMSADVSYEEHIKPTINNPEHAALCIDVAKNFIPDHMVLTDTLPSMGGEDFGAFLEHVPGAYVKIGQGIPNAPTHCCNQGLHNASYDFNDDLIPIAAEYLVRLVEAHST